MLKNALYECVNSCRKNEPEIWFSSPVMLSPRRPRIVLELWHKLDTLFYVNILLSTYLDIRAVFVKMTPQLDFIQIKHL